MATLKAHNKKSSAVKRIMQEANELANDPSTDYTAAPLEEDIFEWSAVIRGAPGTEFEGGLYRIRILLPAEYPFKAPDLMILTPNGRFETNKKICIDGLTSFHAGSWQPAWGVRTAIVGLMSFWQSKGEAMQAIGALDYPVEERKRLAKLSRSWKCPTSGLTNLESLPDAPPPTTNAAASSSTLPSPPSIEDDPASIPLPRTPEPPQSEPSPVSVPLDGANLTRAPSTPPAIDTPPPLGPIATKSESPASNPATNPPPLPSDAVPPPGVTPRAATQRAPAVPPLTAPPPLWLDALLGVCILAIGILVARRLV